MHRKLKEFFETQGRRLAELKVIGGQELIILGETDKLTLDEKLEFRNLWIRMGSIIWALEPIKNRDAYIQEIKEYFRKIEEPYLAAHRLKKGRNLPKGEA